MKTDEEILSEKIDTKVNKGTRRIIENFAKNDQRKLSDAIRVLILEGIKSKKLQ